MLRVTKALVMRLSSGHGTAADRRVFSLQGRPDYRARGVTHVPTIAPAAVPIAFTTSLVTQAYPRTRPDASASPSGETRRWPATVQAAPTSSAPAADAPQPSGVTPPEVPGLTTWP